MLPPVKPIDQTAMIGDGSREGGGGGGG